MAQRAFGGVQHGMVPLHRQWRQRCGTPPVATRSRARADATLLALRCSNCETLKQSVLSCFQLFYPRETFCGILRYVEREDFTFENARKAAGNVAGLCDWVKAMCTYHNIAKVVAPKTDALRKAEQSLLVANKKLSLAMDDLTECQRELDVMQAKFDAAKAEKQRLQVTGQSEAITTVEPIRKDCR